MVAQLLGVEVVGMILLCCMEAGAHNYMEQVEVAGEGVGVAEVVHDCMGQEEVVVENNMDKPYECF